MLAGAASLAIAAGVFTTWQARTLRPETATVVAGGKAQVIAPERRVLTDGSVVELQREAVVEIDYRDNLRHVRLTKGGAHFAVVKDARRPFVVETAGVGVRAVGTAFVVQLTSEAVEVLVTEGRVAVGEPEVLRATGNTTPAAGASVGANERVVVERASRNIPTAPAVVSEAEMRYRLAWRVPRLNFSGAPLDEIVGLFNAHARGDGPARLVLADESLKPLPLSGVLRADNVEALLSILESSYRLKSRRGGAGEIIIYRP